MRERERERERQRERQRESGFSSEANPVIFYSPKN